MIADGELEIRVVEKTDEELICEFVVGGAMRSRKSVNVPAAVSYTHLASIRNRVLYRFMFYSELPFFLFRFHVCIRLSRASFALSSHGVGLFLSLIHI